MFPEVIDCKMNINNPNHIGQWPLTYLWQKWVNIRTRIELWNNYWFQFIYFCSVDIRLDGMAVLWHASSSWEQKRVHIQSQTNEFIGDCSGSQTRNKWLLIILMNQYNKMCTDREHPLKVFVSKHYPLLWSLLFFPPAPAGPSHCSSVRTCVKEWGNISSLLFWSDAKEVSEHSVCSLKISFSVIHRSVQD